MKKIKSQSDAENAKHFRANKTPYCEICELKIEGVCKDTRKCRILSKDEVIDLCSANEEMDDISMDYVLNNFAFIQYEDRSWVTMRKESGRKAKQKGRRLSIAG